MKIRTSILIGLACIFAGLPLAFASDYITCESRDDRRTYCDVRDMRDSEIQLDRQLSKSSCSEGRSWGTDSRGIWVQDGCRAEFRVSRRYGYNGDSRYDRDYSLERERRELEDERYRLEQERLRLERENQQQAVAAVKPEICPSGFIPGRCADRERKHGCKDMRTAGGLGCRTS